MPGRETLCFAGEPLDVCAGSPTNGGQCDPAHALVGMAVSDYSSRGTAGGIAVGTMIKHTPTELSLEIPAQPNDATCGPTALHGVYRYYGDDISLTQVIEEVEPIATGGTLAVNLARHALARGYRARIYTYNLHMFDPTWFTADVDIPERLRLQAEHKADPKLRAATEAYLDFLERGGRLLFEDLGPDLIRRHLRRGHPVLTGLSATYLYGAMREFGGERLTDDDVRGVPTGHFVVLYGYRPGVREVLVADPLGDNPRYGAHYYAVGVDRLLGAIFLGILTYDANLLVLDPGRRAGR